MVKTILMPRCGVDMEEGTVAEWLKHPGDFVHAGETVLSIETDKTVQDIPSDIDGYLRVILLPEGETAKVGTAIAVMTTSPDEPY